MKQYHELETAVLEWAQQKGILDNATPHTQALKTLEEAQELVDATATNNTAEVLDALGDTFVTIIIGAALQNVSLLDCLESAYNVIKKRTGKMINGQFVKD